jgi:hypothetical protein
MIPIKLAMRNFMPYRDNVPPLNFTGIHTACICGDNGNGKSALIDAMTWALWGKARAKNDDDLIYSGETEMEVRLVFAVGQQVYRIIRKHSKPKRRRRSGLTILEFQTATSNGFKPITGNSIAQTQHKIIETLNMDYITFINSAFLRQGRADEFTISDPAKRKQVLADILGFSLYDDLEEQAKELSKQQEVEKTVSQVTNRRTIMLMILLFAFPFTFFCGGGGGQSSTGGTAPPGTTPPDTTPPTIITTSGKIAGNPSNGVQPARLLRSSALIGIGLSPRRVKSARSPGRNPAIGIPNTWSEWSLPPAPARDPARGNPGAHEGSGRKRYP